MSDPPAQPDASSPPASVTRASTGVIASSASVLIKARTLFRIAFAVLQGQLTLRAGFVIIANVYKEDLEESPGGTIDERKSHKQ